MKKVILECKNLKKEFYKNNHVHTAANDINLELIQGECLGIVGESGSGKSTLAKIIMNLEKADSGKVILDKEDITNISGKKLRKVYSNIQMVFQDAIGSFNPKMTIGKSILEYVCNLCFITRDERKEKVYELLEKVGLSKEYYDRYPYELSGGQCQRAAIARALCVHPKVLIFDEATSALDVSVQAQVIELLQNMREEYNISYLFISHDLSLVSSFCDRICVMKNGSIMEIGTADDIINNSQSDYTKLLLNSVFHI